MRFLVTITSASDQWKIDISCPDVDAEWQLKNSMSKSGSVGGWQFPVPARAVDAEPHAELCAPGNSAARADAFARISQRQPKDVVARFGQYLFESLLGAETWGKILAKAEQHGDSFLELALSFPPQENNLQRLPWEMLHDGRVFLAERYPSGTGRLLEIAVTRLVVGANFTPRRLSFPPRILFVIGTAVDEQAIRPAAEIMGLLRQLRRSGRGVNAREIIEATPARIRDAIEDFQPDVVHFICHGAFDRELRRSYLELMPDRPGEPKARYADQLAGLLQHPNGQLPAMVVLSACYSAGGGTGRLVSSGEIAPLSAELVAHGIPIVVGMSGRVADDACRLFTRRFGDAILGGEALVRATAEGRRSVFVDGQSAYKSVDWAFPTVFLSERVPSDFVPVEEVRDATHLDIDARIAAYDIERPPIFCGRHELFAEYYKLIATQDPNTFAQRYSTRKPSVLGIHGDSGMGKSRVIEELTAQALRDGLLPITLVVRGGIDEAPRSLDDLRDRLANAMERACDAFAVAYPAPFRMRDSAASQSARHLQQSLVGDLQAVLAECSQQGGPRRAIVLWDEVQDYDATFLRDLFDRGKNVLGNFGLGSAGNPIPLVLAFSMQGPSAVLLKSVLEQSLPWFKSLPIGPFSEKGEDLLAYRRVLLHPFDDTILPGTSDVPWAFDDMVEAAVMQKHDAKLRKMIKGVPAKLSTDTFFVLASWAAEDRYLVKADDARLLQTMRGTP